MTIGLRDCNSLGFFDKVQERNGETSRERSKCLKEKDNEREGEKREMERKKGKKEK